MFVNPCLILMCSLLRPVCSLLLRSSQRSVVVAGVFTSLSVRGSQPALPMNSCRNSVLTHTHTHAGEEDEAHVEIQGFSVSNYMPFFSFSFCQSLVLGSSTLNVRSTRVSSRQPVRVVFKRSPVRSQSPVHLIFFFSPPATHFSRQFSVLLSHTASLRLRLVLSLDPVTDPQRSPPGPHSRPQQCAQPKPGGHPAHQSWSPLSKDFLLMSVHGIRHRGFNVTG